MIESSYIDGFRKKVEKSGLNENETGSMVMNVDCGLEE